MSGVSSRESFVDNSIEPRTVISKFFWFGCHSFGTLHDQMQSFQLKFVDEEQWFTDTQFKEIVNVAQSLPGPNATQVLILVATLSTKSPYFGFLAFAAFCLPSGILLMLFGVFMDQYIKHYNSMNVYIRLTVLGFKAAGGALLVRRATDAIREYVGSYFAISIIIASAILYFIFPTTACIYWCFIFGVIISLYVETQKRTKLSRNAKIVLKSMNKHGWIFGKWALAILVGLYLYLGLSSKIHQEETYSFAYIFYFAGCFTFGPATTVFPLLYPAFASIDQITDNQFWFGVPLSFLVPGNPSNIAIYYGTVLYGVLGGLLGWLFLQLPSFLLLYGIMPSWDQYRDRAGIQRIMIGMNCVALGFLSSSGFLGLDNVLSIDYGIPITIFVLSLFLSIINIPSYVIVIVGGLLANARRWGLVDFRQVIPPNY